jgi:hypothetical protein
MNSTLIALCLAVVVVYGGGVPPSLSSDRIDSAAVEKHVAALDAQPRDVNLLWRKAEENLRQAANHLR